MKILIKQFGGKNMSWSCFGWSIAEALKDNNEVHYFSTDGIKHFPESLKSNLIGYVEENKAQVFGRLPDETYDSQISYTSMKNFPFILSHGNKNRIGIWCYEWAGKNVIPSGFAKHYKACDYLCPPSEFAKQVFLDSGIPEKSMKVIPHGINVSNFKNTDTLDISKRRFKILANIAQNHMRKNIPGLLDAYGKAFNSKDDVCLILKAKDREVTQQFEVSLKGCLKKFYEKYPKHGEVKVFSDFVDDISILYRSVDCVFTMAHSECFYFPGLEGLAAKKFSIAPNWGGQLDFLNESNSLLVSGKEVMADPRSMYWESKSNAIWFEPNIDDAVEKLRYAYNNFEALNNKIDQESILKLYDWKNIAKQYVGLFL